MRYLGALLFMLTVASGQDAAESPPAAATPVAAGSRDPSTPGPFHPQTQTLPSDARTAE